jgi:NRPS condensation-like uncharacterized protein
MKTLRDYIKLVERAYSKLDEKDLAQPNTEESEEVLEDAVEETEDAVAQVVKLSKEIKNKY